MFLSEVQQREDELNEVLGQQNELIASANNEIFKLKKIIENTEKPKKTLSTQTVSLAKTVATQSESTDCGNEHENLEQTEDINRVNTILSKKEATIISNNKESNSSNINNKNRILIVAGAHGKNLIGHLSRQKKEHQMIESILMTNCSNELLVGTAIKESKNYTTSDTLIIWTNRINVSIVNKLASQTNTNIIIITEPYRYDNKDKNLDIYENNLSLQNDLFHKRSNHMKILECNNILRRTNYERNGLQISSFGKLFLSRAILNLIESNPQCCNATIPYCTLKKKHTNVNKVDKKKSMINQSSGRADEERTNSSTDGEFDMTNQEENSDNNDVRGDVSSDEDSESANFLLEARPPPTI
ncbi:hypothetical protein JTB14_001875 [Gonioctena quinquepunctata]|nr:hypothetical protein JTB14_001875 [Gonioctena quinquepunctata]